MAESRRDRKRRERRKERNPAREAITDKLTPEQELQHEGYRAQALLDLQELIDHGLIMLTKGDIDVDRTRAYLENCKARGYFPDPTKIAAWGELIAIEFGVVVLHGHPN